MGKEGSRVSILGQNCVGSSGRGRGSAVDGKRLMNDDDCDINNIICFTKDFGCDMFTTIVRCFMDTLFFILQSTDFQETQFDFRSPLLLKEIKLYLRLS